LPIIISSSTPQGGIRSFAESFFVEKQENDFKDTNPAELDKNL